MIDIDILDQTMLKMEYCKKIFDYQNLEENELHFSNPDVEESADEQNENNNFETKHDSIADFIDDNNDFDVNDIYNNNNSNYYNIHDYHEDYDDNRITDINNSHGDRIIFTSRGMCFQSLNSG